MPLFCAGLGWVLRERNALRQRYEANRAEYGMLCVVDRRIPGADTRAASGEWSLLREYSASEEYMQHHYDTQCFVPASSLHQIQSGGWQRQAKSSMASRRSSQVIILPIPDQAIRAEKPCKRLLSHLVDCDRVKVRPRWQELWQLPEVLAGSRPADNRRSSLPDGAKYLWRSGSMQGPANAISTCESFQSSFMLCSDLKRCSRKP